MKTKNGNNPSQVMAWIGFGISLALFVFVWCINALIFGHIGENNSTNASYSFFTLYVLLIVIGGILGILGLVFSIVGLLKAYKNGLKKLPGVLGIILWCASLLSLFAPIFYTLSTAGTEPAKIITPPTSEEKTNKEEILILICKDNVLCQNEVSQIPANRQIYFSDEDFENKFNEWLREGAKSEILKTDGSNIVIKANKEVDFSLINKIFELLRNNELNKFVLQTSLYEDESHKD